ncbi:MAG TPA: hypothetical protein VMY36_00455 [Patescibacteria group bacterium]|nr:hypothetical protein [Patescibacteria group bacterium]
MKQDNDFLQPVISVLGLAISLIIAILPLFKLEPLIKLFTNKDLAQPVSFLTFILGVAIVWQIIEFHPFVSIPLGNLKDRGRGFPEYWKVLGTNNIIWLLVFSSFFFGFLFLFAQSWSGNFALGQAIFYLLFFLSLISIFSILFTQTRQKYMWNERRKNFPQTVFETLERNRLVKPGIEIYENVQLGAQELQDMGFKNVFLAKKMTVKTISQEPEVIKFIISSDGEEILKVIKKGK